jgi:hypothetical protein
MQAEGVIDRLAQAFYDGNLAARIDGGSEYDFLKQIYWQMLRAGKRQEHSAGVQMLE